MNLSISVTIIRRNFTLDVPITMTYSDFIDKIVDKCTEYYIICYPCNLKCFIRDDLVTEESWNELKEIYNEKTNITSRIIIVPIECPLHK